MYKPYYYCLSLYYLCCNNSGTAVQAFVSHHHLSLSSLAFTTSSSIDNILLKSKRSNEDQPENNADLGTGTTDNTRHELSRRTMMDKGAKILSAPLLLNSNLFSNEAQANVGTLPEYKETNAVLQGLTVDVADSVQQNAMIDFLRDGLQFKLLRQRKVGSVTETWMGFGPEEMNIPNEFEMAVSSFASYGGHASICIRYDSQAIETFYKQGNDVSGENIAYVQVGVPEYRISQMVKNGGNILDAYGVVNVISPSGLPMRGIVGISPDPIMFVALNCQNLKQSREFYEQLGFVAQEYPFCRPNKGMGQFEPPQPNNSVYLAPSANSMGVLLLQSKKRNVKVNPAFRGMKIVYSPSEGTVVDANDVLKVQDPSGTNIVFQPYEIFEKEESSTRVVNAAE